MTDVDVEALPFDQYQRYRLVADLLHELRASLDRPLRVLDVGGRTALLRAFLPEDRIELVDVEGSQEEGLVLGDGAALPFRADAFDAVCAFDTLEHVPPAARQAFVGECARVAERWVVLAGPYAHPRVDEAEERLVDFLRHKLGVEHRYLAEHRGNGLPDRKDTQAWLEAAGATVTTFGHGDLSRWLALMCLELYLDHDPMLRPVAARFFRFYNRALYDSDQGDELYRHAVVATFAGSEAPRGERLPARTRAPQGAAEAITELAAELLAFDREKDAWEPEVERLKGVIAGLEQDLGGHRSRLADRTADLEQHQETLNELRETYDRALVEHAEQVATLEADLAEHAAALTEARGAHGRALADAAAEREAFEKDLAEHRTALAATEADLAAHRASLADLRRELAAREAAGEEQARATAALEAELRGQVDEHRAHGAALEGQLAETQAGAEAIQAELVAARADIEALVRDLGARDGEIAHLRAELRDRWRNLKRALGRKPEFSEE